MMNPLDAWLETFPWESDSQKKGILSYFKWLADKTPLKRYPALSTLIVAVRPFDLFLLQRDQERDEWWRETTAQQIRNLEDQIAILKQELSDLRRGNAELH